MIKTVGSFLFFLTVACILSIGKQGKTFPKYNWQTPPSIVNCIHEDDMNPKIFDDAVKFWEDHGHTFLFKENYLGSLCDSETPYGFIVIKISYDLNFYVLGTTQKIFNKDLNEMKGSIINLNYYFIDDGLILTHEIGHALGYNHVNKIGHIMHPMRPDADYYFY